MGKGRPSKAQAREKFIAATSRVKTPEMGVIDDLKGHAKSLVKKHGGEAVNKVTEHLGKYVSQAVEHVAGKVTKKVKSKLPKQLHGTVDKIANAGKDFAHNKSKEYLKKGSEFAKGRIAQVK